MNDESEDKVVNLRSDEQIIAGIAQRKSNPLTLVDDIIDAQADYLIILAARGTLNDFTAMRPINPSVVHCIIIKLLGVS